MLLSVNAAPMSRSDNSLSEAIAPRLVAVREARGYKTTLAASKASGVGNSTLARYEAAQRCPSVECLLKLSRTYDVPLDFLCAGITGCVDPDLLAKLDLKQG